MKTIKRTCIFTIILFATFTLCSCEDDIDDDPTVIHGQVLDYYTHQPVQDYKIVLSSTKSGFFGSIYSEIDSIKSDSIGNINYSFIAKNGYKYHILSNSAKYEGMSSQDLKYETVNQLVLNLKPLKSISLKLVNKTGKYKRFHISKFPLEGDGPYRFKNDTSVIIRSVVPDAYHNLEIDLYECETCGESIVYKEKVWIQNVDTSYLKREF